jgi:hypothetical protein
VIGAKPRCPLELRVAFTLIARIIDPMTSARYIGVAALCASVFARPAVASELKLEITDGRVTLVARDVPARQILTEWARIGQTTIVNADKLPGTPLTLQLDSVPERQALDIVLRNASGYLAAPRAIASAGASTFDRVIIMATSTAVAGNGRPNAAAAANGGGANGGQQVFTQPYPQPNFPQQFTPAPGAYMGGEPVDDQDGPMPMPMPNGGSMPMQINPGTPGFVPPMNMQQPGGMPMPIYPNGPNGPPVFPNGQQQQPPVNTNPFNTPGAPGVIAPNPLQPGMVSPFLPPQKTPQEQPQER